MKAIGIPSGIRSSNSRNYILAETVSYLLYSLNEEAGSTKGIL